MARYSRLQKIFRLTRQKLIDVTGLYVTPGIIDMHAHAFNGTDVDAYIANGLTSLPPDGFTFRQALQAVVDAGSSVEKFSTF